MPSQLLLESGTALTWAESGGDYDMTIDSLATTAAGQGAKGSLGTPWAPEYSVEFMIDTATAPGIGETVDLYWAESTSGTAGTSNPGGTSGTDAAYTGIGSATVAESLPQLAYIGSLVCVDEATTNLITYFVMSARLQWGMPVVVNNTAQTLGTGSYVKITPIIPEGQ